MLKLNAYQLKWIAIIGMFLQHMLIAWSAIIPNALRIPLYGVGGFTFPIMAFFVVEGYRHTSNLKRYVLRLLIIGLIALPFHIAVLGISLGGGNPMMYPWLNIMFSIVLSLLVLYMYDKIKYRAVFWLVYVVLIVPVSLLFFEWYFIGVTMVLLFHIIPHEKIRRIVPPLFTGVCWFVLGQFVTFVEMDGTHTFMAYDDFPTLMIVFAAVCAMVSVLLLGYSGERGKKSKWLFYIFYPAHFVLLAVVGVATGTIDLSLLW